jgi:hypothetical protein
MPSQTPVEIADRMSRKRAGLMVAAAVVFLVSAVARPLLSGGLDAAHHERLDLWAINAVVLLAVLATGGTGILNSRRIRSLVHDEVSRSHYRTAIVAGYWAAMTAAMSLFAWPGAGAVGARTAIYVIVSAGIAVALFAFAGLELRAHRDA